MIISEMCNFLNSESADDPLLELHIIGVCSWLERKRVTIPTIFFANLSMNLVFYIYINMWNLSPSTLLIFHQVYMVCELWLKSEAA